MNKRFWGILLSLTMIFASVVQPLAVQAEGTASAEESSVLTEGSATALPEEELIASALPEDEALTEASSGDTSEGDEDEGEPEWPNKPAADWYNDYVRRFVYIPPKYDENHNLIEMEDYQLWLYRYQPREEHKDDEYLVIPSIQSYQYIDGSPIEDVVSDQPRDLDSPVGFKVVLVSWNINDSMLLYEHPRENGEGMWSRKGADVIKGIKIEDKVMTGLNASYMFAGLNKLTHLEAKGLDTSNT